MKYLQLTSVFILTLCLYQIKMLGAQVPARVECGSNVESVFAQDRQVHEYHIDMTPGIKLIIHGESRAGAYERLLIDLGLIAPNNFEIDYLTPYDYEARRTSTIETSPLSVAGTYLVRVIGFTDTGGSYRLYFSCVEEDGTVISSNNLVQAVQCGSIVDNEIRLDRELHRYYIYLNQGDRVQITATSLAGDYEILKLDMGMYAPNNFEIDYLTPRDYEARRTSTIETSPLSVAGVYWLGVIGFTSTSGRYTLDVTCVLADGAVVNPGDAPPISLGSGDQGVSEPVIRFSGFGFPGLAPVDFTNVARVPIPAGIPMSGAVTPTGGEILGYQFDAEAGDTVELSFDRLSGNLNLGLVVIDLESNIIYQASLVTTQSMTARFTVPTAGQYTAGIFRISLMPPSAPEPTAFQVTVAVKP